MRSDELRAVWLVLRREYVERVKSVSFLASTFAAPALLLALAATPTLFTGGPLSPAKRIVVACSSAELADEIMHSFHQSGLWSYRTQIVTDTTPFEKRKLLEMIRKSRIDGFVWLDQAALTKGRVVYTSRSGVGELERQGLDSVIYRAMVRFRLASHGLSRGDVNRALRPVALEFISINGTVDNEPDRAIAAIVVTVTIITILEMSLLSYGIIVMRSVLEDKTSRMVEILLCSVTPRALMAGKIGGVGALSLTQVAIWGGMAAAGVAAARALGVDFANLTLGPGAVSMFILFYVFGYLLYSSLYAALGAAFNAADEAQYWSFVLTLPLLFAGVAAWSLFDQAHSAVAVGLSLVPLFAPVMMCMRIAVGSAAIWQIALSLGLLAATIYAAWILSAQVFRVGTLMYGKKPKLREIARWFRYA